MKPVSLFVCSVMSSVCMDGFAAMEPAESISGVGLRPTRNVAWLTDSGTTKEARLGSNATGAGKEAGAGGGISLGRYGRLFGYAGAGSESFSDPWASNADRFHSFGLATEQLASSADDASSVFSSGIVSRAEMLSLGYAWRNLRVEGAAYTLRPKAGEHLQRETPRLDSTSGKVTLAPTPGWALQFTRGSVSTLDQIDAGERLRRTALSATYRHPMQQGMLQTTFAWGRSIRQDRDVTTGYLVESIYREAAHSLFGRLEQVGSDALARDDAAPHQAFKVNKLSVGYLYEVHASGPVRYDLGGMMSRYMVPADASPVYGGDRNGLLLFMRLRFQ
ncbi:hypothetical protein SAMN06265795_102109 [Noviherbaspirillum humi]|uniref:Porin n=1 Tax=Noviherbaspirillum humi TaxID=1688639 RepID=A0A239DCD5_9BURK|nr:hypothetical protein [Noviherbaspirillum humi]SNS29957.1 hypothetical protein SAMN06265795_102109 [Noviherbaspirillum humi]